jgi:hypothetical protein
VCLFAAACQQCGRRDTSRHTQCAIAAAPPRISAPAASLSLVTTYLLVHHQSQRRDRERDRQERQQATFHIGCALAFSRPRRLSLVFAQPFSVFQNIFNFPCVVLELPATVASSLDQLCCPDPLGLQWDFLVFEQRDIHVCRRAGAHRAQAGAGKGRAAVCSPTNLKTAITCTVVCVSRRLRACITTRECPSEVPRTLYPRRLTRALLLRDGGRRRDARASRAVGRSGRQPGAQRWPRADLRGSSCRQHVVGKKQQGACGGGFRQAWWRGRRCGCPISCPVASVHSCVRLHTALGCLQHSALLDLTCRLDSSLAAALADPPQARKVEAAALERREARLEAYDAALQATEQVRALRVYAPACGDACVRAFAGVSCLLGNGAKLRVWYGYS